MMLLTTKRMHSASDREANFLDPIIILVLLVVEIRLLGGREPFYQGTWVVRL